MACQRIYCLIAYGVFAKIPEKDMKRYKNPFSSPALAFNVWSHQSLAFKDQTMQVNFSSRHMCI